MEIDLPDGFNKPEGVKDGEVFNVSAAVYIEGNKLCIESIDGFDVSQDKDRSDPANSGFIASYQEETGY